MTIAEFRLSGENSACKTAFDRLPSLECEMEPVVAGDIGVWLSGAERSAVEDALAADLTVECHERVEAGEDRWFYELEFAGAFDDLFELVADRDRTILGAVGRKGVWTIRFRLPQREDVREVYDGVAALGLDPEVVRLADPAADHGLSGLTAEQYEALAVASTGATSRFPARSP